MSAETDRDDFIAGLHSLADLLSAHPDIQAPGNIDNLSSHCGESRFFVHDVDQAIAIRDLMTDMTMKRSSGDFPLEFNGRFGVMKTNVMIYKTIALAEGAVVPEDFEINPLLLMNKEET
jgi:hypothetical protein